MRRAFVCLRPPEGVCDRLSEIAEDLDDGRPVPFENLHLTLAFLGTQPIPALEEVAIGLESLGVPAFELEVTGVAVFGDRRPRSAHAVVAPTEALTRLRARVRRAAGDAGIDLPGERFTPHVTLARFGEKAGRAGDDLPRWLAEHAGLRTGPFPCGPVRLWSSTLGAGGSVYTEMFTAELAGA